MSSVLFAVSIWSSVGLIGLNPALSSATVSMQAR